MEWITIQDTNHGMKNNASAVTPTMNMDTAAKAMNMQSDIKASSLKEVVYNDFTRSQKNGLNIPQLLTRPLLQKEQSCQ